jgi:hypothetical protein
MIFLPKINNEFFLIKFCWLKYLFDQLMQRWWYKLKEDGYVMVQMIQYVGSPV